MITAVLDTSVVVSAAKSRRGASFKLIELLVERKFKAVLSATLALEYEEVLNREAAAVAWDPKQRSDFLYWICHVSKHQAIYFRLRPFLADPDDDFLVELAVAASVDYLVTHNVRDFTPVRSLGVNIVTPGEFLKVVERKQ